MGLEGDGLGRRHIPPPLSKGGKPAGYWVRADLLARQVERVVRLVQTTRIRRFVVETRTFDDHRANARAEFRSTISNGFRSAEHRSTLSTGGQSTSTRSLAPFAVCSTFFRLFF